MQVTYKASVHRDPFGSFIAVFDDVVDAVSIGGCAEEALRDAEASLRVALENRLQAGKPLPAPRAAFGRDVTVMLADAPALRISA